MRAQADLVIAAGCGFFVGVPAGFFFVFAPVFTDGPAGGPERWVSLLLTFGVYAAAAALPLLVPSLRRRVGRLRAYWLGLFVPALTFLAWYSAREPSQLGLNVRYAVLVLTVAASYWMVSARFRRPPSTS